MGLAEHLSRQARANRLANRRLHTALAGLDGAAFLSPPVAMSAFYLKGVAPPHVTINQIFAGMMPYMLIVILCMVLMYIWPGLTLWLPQYLYG